MFLFLSLCNILKLINCDLAVLEQFRKLFLKIKLLSLFLWILFSYKTKADMIKLLEIPLDNGRLSTYSVNQIKKCSFEGVHEIQSSELIVDRKGNKLIQQINLLQRKLNYKVTRPLFYSDYIIFSLSNASNILFEFSLEDCILKKKIHMNDKTISFEEVDIEYDNSLNSPVIKKNDYHW